MATKGNFEIAKNFYLKAININKNIESMSEIGRLFQDEKILMKHKNILKWHLSKTQIIKQQTLELEICI